MCFFGGSSYTPPPPPPPPAPEALSSPIPMAEGVSTKSKAKRRGGASYKRRGRYSLRTDKAVGGYAEKKGVNVPG